jgi:hypothetical protein
MTELDIARGRKEIMELLRVEDWGTVRTWVRRYNLPLRRMPGRQQPFLFVGDVKRWLLKYSDLEFKNKNNVTSYKLKKK